LGAVEQAHTHGPGRLTGAGLGGERPRHAHHGREGICGFAGEAHGHGATVGQAHDVHALAVDGVLLRELFDEAPQVSHVVGLCVEEITARVDGVPEPRPRGVFLPRGGHRDHAFLVGEPGEIKVPVRVIGRPAVPVQRDHQWPWARVLVCRRYMGDIRRPRARETRSHRARCRVAARATPRQQRQPHNNTEDTPHPQQHRPFAPPREARRTPPLSAPPPLRPSAPRANAVPSCVEIEGEAEADARSARSSLPAVRTHRSVQRRDRPRDQCKWAPRYLP